MNENTINLSTNILYEHFMLHSGIMAFFLTLKISGAPMENFEICFDTWAKKQRAATQETVGVIMDMNLNPEKYTDYELAAMKDISPEDYQIIMEKSLAKLKKDVKVELEQFLKHGNT